MDLNVLDFEYNQFKPIQFEITTNSKKVASFINKYNLLNILNSVKFTQKDTNLYVADAVISLEENFKAKKVFVVQCLAIKYYIISDDQNIIIDYQCSWDGEYNYKIKFGGKIVYLLEQDLIVKTADSYLYLNLDNMDITWDGNGNGNGNGNITNVIYFSDYEYLNGIFFKRKEVIIVNSLFNQIVSFPSDYTYPLYGKNLQKVHFTDKVIELDINLFESTLFYEMLENGGDIQLMVSSEVLENPYKGLEFLDYAMITNIEIHRRYYLMLIYYELRS